jgi:hypothetical protein
MLLSKKGTLQQVFVYLRPRTHTSLLHTVYVFTVYFFTQGRWEGGRVEPEIRLERTTVYKTGSKIPT